MSLVTARVLYHLHLQAMIKEFVSSNICKPDETIGDIHYNNETLALIIYKHSKQIFRMELRSSEMFD